MPTCEGQGLSNAQFENADLRQADLRGADLEGAQFAGADLRGADLRDTSLFGTTFAKFDAAASKSNPVITNPALVDSDTRIDAGALDTHPILSGAAVNPEE